MTRRLGRYELVHRLGAGGGGEVWEAVLHGPAGFRRRVALKLLQEGSATPEAREALLQEARLGALVAHPHVVSTLELGEHDGQWYFVMDLVRGCTASALRRRGPLPPGALLDIGVQVCDGLAHIHGLTDQDGWLLGLVHRACEVDLSWARVHILRGRRAEGVASLEAGWTRGSRVESETRAAIALWMARAGSADRALEMNDELEQRATDDEPYLLAQCALIRAEAELARGLPQHARGALLQGSAELGRLDLPVRAPLLNAYEGLRERLAALR